MKTILIALTLILFGSALSGAELKTTSDSVKFGDAKLNIWSSGIMTMTDKELFTNWYFHFTTKHPDKWFAMANKACSPQATPMQNGVWKFKAAVPVSATEKADVAMTLSTTPFNTVEIDCLWKTADRKNILESGFFLTFPVKQMEGKNLIVNSKPYPIRNETKYGWFHETLENPEFTLFQGDAIREYTLSAAGKYAVSIGTVKDGSVTIRINTLPGADTMKLTFTPR